MLYNILWYIYEKEAVGFMFKKIISNIKKWVLSLTLKKIIIISIAIILIISPLIIAVGNIIYRKQLQKDNLFTVILLDNNSVEIARESNVPETANEDSLTRIFYELVTSPRTDAILPDGLNKDIFIKAITTLNGQTEEIICYFSPESDEGVFIDTSNNVFVIPKELNESFLLLPYSEIFYGSSRNYDLVTIDKDTIIPSYVEWHYKNIDGNYIKAYINETTSDQRTYDITSTVNINFTKKPDEYSIIIESDGKEIYKDANKNFANVTTFTSDSGNNLHVIIEAKWHQSRKTDRYGYVKYDFFVHIKNRSTFTPSKTNVSRGDFILLECTNITDISKIEFSSNIQNFSPAFKQYNDKTIGLIPIPNVDFDDDKLIFTVSYGASAETFEVNILPDNTPEIYGYDINLFDSETTPTEAVDSIVKLLTKKYNIPSDNVYFQGNISSPQNMGFDLKQKHNSTVVWGEELQYYFLTVGNRYTSDTDNTLVRTVENGIIAEISENDLLGKYVVVDHGCGLRTWYSGLSYIDVNVGDILLEGESIGKTSPSIFNGEHEFFLFCTAYDTIIDPNFLFD